MLPLINPSNDQWKEMFVVFIKTIGVLIVLYFFASVFVKFTGGSMPGF